MGLFDKKKRTPKYLAAIYIEHMEGIASLPYNEGIALRIRPDAPHIEMEYKKKKEKVEMLLPFSQIVSVNIINWEKTFIKALNPLSEGIIGGLIGGDTMAVVSAIDAKGRMQAERVKKENAIKIQYHPKGDPGTISRLVFWDSADFAAKKDTVRFAEALCRSAGLPGPNYPNYSEPQPKGPIYL